MIILGVDTSLRSTGYGVVEVEGNRFRALEWGNIPNAASKPLGECILAIYDKISALIERWAPDAASIEKVIYGKNANTMLLLGEARGAVIAAIAKSKIEIFEYEPRRVKMAVCGNGMAEKYQIQRMVKTLLKLDEIPQNDAADALALAICHANALSLPLLAKNIAGSKSRSKGDLLTSLVAAQTKSGAKRSAFATISLAELKEMRRK